MDGSCTEGRLGDESGTDGGQEVRLGINLFEHVDSTEHSQQSLCLELAIVRGNGVSIRTDE